MPGIIEPLKQFEEIKRSTVDSLKGVFPIEGKTHTLRLENVWLEDDLQYNDFASQRRAQDKDQTWGVPVYVSLSLISNSSGKVIDMQNKIKLFTLPKYTPRGSFIVNGNEYTATNQLRLKPGVYTIETESGEIKSKTNLAKGLGFNINQDSTTLLFTMEVGQAKIKLYPILKALDMDDSIIKKAWGNEVFEANKEATDHLMESQSKRLVESLNFRKEASHDFGTNKNFITDYFNNKTQISPETTKLTLGKEFNKVSPEMLLAISKRLLNTKKGDMEVDDRDSLAFKEIHSINDFVHERITKSKNDLLKKLSRNLDNKEKISHILNPKDFNKLIETEFMGAHSDVTDQTNPVTMAINLHRTTIKREGGITDPHMITNAARSLHPSHFGYVDPVNTPEGPDIGANLYLSNGLIKDNKTMRTRVLNIKTGKMEHLSPEEIYDKYVAFPDQGVFDPTTKRVKFLAPLVKAMHKESIVEVPNAQINYSILSSHSLFSLSTNMIPFLQNDQGNRTMMASKQISQAIPLVNNEAPLVVVRSPSGKSYMDIMGEAHSFSSPVEGVINKINKDYIEIKDKKNKIYKENIYNNFPLVGHSVINSKIIVKEGDFVKKGQLLADTNFTKNKTLALGTNLKTAIIPFKGYNFEDGLVITESAANKLTSEHIYQETVRTDQDMTTNKNKFISIYPNAVFPANHNKYDEDGVIKTGEKVNYNDPLVMILRKEENDPEDIILGRLKRSKVNPWKDRSVRWMREDQGEVIRVFKGRDTFKVYVKVKEIAKIGDKLTTMHGSKGVITKIIQDNEAPYDKNGEPVELMFNPHGLVSRMNPGFLLEGAVSKVAKKTGKPVEIDNFKNINYTKEVQNLLKKHGISDKEPLYDPITKKKLGDIFVGYPHTLKLYKQSSTNFSARYRDNFDINRQPAKGGTEGSKALDLMSFYAMLSHGANANLKEMAIPKAEGATEQNDKYWEAIINGTPVPKQKPTFAYDKFTSMLKGAGVNIEKNGNELILGPLTDKETEKLSSGIIRDPRMFKSAKSLLEEKGGLFDPIKTGGKQGNKWTHIELTEAIPNPIFEGSIKKLTNLSSKDFNGLITGKTFIDKDGKINQKAGITGGKAFKKLLENINVDEALKQYEEEINFVNDNKADVLRKKIKLLRALKYHNLKPEEAYMKTKIPIIPPIYRPIIELKDGNLLVSDVNHLYKHVGLANNQLNELKKSGVPEEFHSELKQSLYDGVKALTGLTSSSATLSKSGIFKKDIKGFLGELAGEGKQAKEGFFQAKVLSKKQELTGRGTIIPDPTLNVDEVAIPNDMAWKLFTPFLLRELRKLGYKRLESEKMIAERAPVAGRALDSLMKDHPLLLNRAPSLHKFSVMAFFPKKTSGTTVKIPPFVTRGYNADFDGDAMQLHVPISNEAVREAHKLLPSNNLYNPGTGGLMMIPEEASALGLYKLSHTPSGRSVINQIIRKYIEDFPPVREVLDKKKTNEVLKNISKKNPGVYTKIIDELKTLADNYIYESGFTVGLSDLITNNKKRDIVIDAASKEAEKVKKQKISEIEKYKKIENIFLKADKIVRLDLEKNLAKEGNEFYSMVNAGAKGKMDNLKQMLSSPVVVKDYRDRLVLIPIKKSYAEGLDTASYFVAQQGARKGMIDRQLQVEKPGAFNKELMVSSVTMVVSMKDCETRQGIDINVDSQDFLDRYLAENIVGIATRNTLTTNLIQSKLKKASIEIVKLRSPLTCEAPRGVCAKCQGLNENGQEYAIGDNVGSIHGQSMSEPLTQLTMKTFHTGGVIGAAEPVGYEKIDSLMKMKEIKSARATLAEKDGIINKITKTELKGYKIDIDGEIHNVIPGLNLKVKENQHVKKGDAISEGLISPHDLVRLKGMMPAQNYIVDELQKAYHEQGVPLKKNVFETVVRSVGNSTRIVHPGDSSYLRGEIAPYTKVKYFNEKERITKVPISMALGFELHKSYGPFPKGKIMDSFMIDTLRNLEIKEVEIERKPIRHIPTLVGTTRLPYFRDDWMAQMGYNRIKEAIVDGASEAHKTKIDSMYSPVPAFAYGANFGEWEELREDDRKEEI
jgi:DNA-directed RNA polymerase subunit beta'